MKDEEASIAPTDDRLHDLDTIARRLDVSTKMVRRLIGRGELGFHRVGRLVRISDYLTRVRGFKDVHETNVTIGREHFGRGNP
jgi:excisionase family DNA binding protein